MGRLIIGYWDCDRCKLTKITGDQRVCPGCGNPRNAKTRFYIDETSQVAAEPEAATVSRKPDWICRECDALNAAENESCCYCGHVRDERDREYVSGPPVNAVTLRPEAKALLLHWWGNNRRRVRNIGLVAVLLLVIAASVFAWIAAPRKVTAAITDKAWTRSIAVERYKIVDDSSWDLPPDALLQYTRDEIHHYESVYSHHEDVAVTRSRIAGYDTTTQIRDLGNGYFEEVSSQTPVYENYTDYESRPVYVNVPRYQVKYYYQQWRWVYERSIDTQGTHNSPSWGTLNLAEGERASTRSECYTLYFQYQDDELACQVPHEVWAQADLGATHTFEIRLGGHATWIE